MRIIWTAAVILVAQTGAASMHDCQAKLADIAAGKLSADDQPIVEQCIMNGYATSDDVLRAYEAAKRNRG